MPFIIFQNKTKKTYTPSSIFSGDLVMKLISFDVHRDTGRGADVGTRIHDIPGFTLTKGVQFNFESNGETVTAVGRLENTFPGFEFAAQVSVVTVQLKSV